MPRGAPLVHLRCPLHLRPEPHFTLQKLTRSQVAALAKHVVDGTASRLEMTYFESIQNESTCARIENDPFKRPTKIRQPSIINIVLSTTLEVCKGKYCVAECSTSA